MFYYDNIRDVQAHEEGEREKKPGGPFRSRKDNNLRRRKRERETERKGPGGRLSAGGMGKGAAMGFLTQKRGGEEPARRRFPKKGGNEYNHDLPSGKEGKRGGIMRKGGLSPKGLY